MAAPPGGVTDGLPAGESSRRDFLRRGSLAAAALLLGGGGAGACRRGAPAPGPAPPGVAPLRALAPVRVRQDRVIRTLAGLRPFRPSGFVVRVESFGERTVVHNYGHGGGGISLAWGSSELAADLATEAAGDRAERRAAVLGAGIMGLTTARLLQDRGFAVTIYARDLPPQTTSNVGGGQWSPFTVSTSGRTTPAYDRQFERAARLSHRRYQDLVGPRYGVRWIENFVLRDRPRAGPRGGPIADLFYDEEDLPPGSHPFASPHVSRFTTMLVEPATFLFRMMDDVLLRGGRIEVRDLRSLDEVLSLEEDLVVNCTGLGARALFGDAELHPIRGQLVVLLPQPEVDYVTLAGGAYMFPRSDGIVLGGSQEPDEWSTEPTEPIVSRILEGNRRVFEGMADPERRNPGTLSGGPRPGTLD